MIKQLKNQLYFGLIGITISGVVSQNAFAMERLGGVVVGSSKLIMRSLPVSRMPVRLYSSTVSQNPDIDLTEEWNKGWVPNASFKKADLKELPSIVALTDEQNQPSDPSVSHTEQHKSLKSREWLFDPTRSLYYRREYYNSEELEKHLNLPKTQQLQPTELNADTVEFTIQKKN